MKRIALAIFLTCCGCSTTRHGSAPPDVIIIYQQPLCPLGGCGLATPIGPQPLPEPLWDRRNAPLCGGLDVVCL